MRLYGRRCYTHSSRTADSLVCSPIRPELGWSDSRYFHMSTTQTPTTTGPEQSRAARALRLFDDLLFESPEVCSACFARIRDHEEFDEDVVRGNRLGTGNRPTETLERAGSGVVGQDCRDHDEYGAKRSYHGRTYCGECGSPGGTARGDHIVSKQAARSHADRVVRRLHELGYYPDLGELYSTVERLKSNPDYQGHDREIFAVAVYLALEAGRTAPNVPSRVDVGPVPPELQD